MDKKFKTKLTSEEERVIINKGTEAPFTGKYDQFFENGIYKCKRCGAALFKSDDKFDAQCGWPSFDAEIPGAVRHQDDADGIRTEISCVNCSAHLGHVFIGEHLTDKNVRYCVNSISMVFEPAKIALKSTETAYFAGGCFWGVEYYFQNLKGVISTEVGFMGGTVPNPTFEQVYYENTGHAETLKVVFDPEIVSYETLTRLFFEIHDPTQVNQQGPDIGIQYRSVVFYTNKAQKKVTEKLIQILKDKGFKVATQLEEAQEFYSAEEYHQKYYQKKGHTPYCHIRVKRF